ncbi:ABC transporter permease [Leuconostoc miyukkimchii]|uniref:ABC transporter permease n=1 Tax=Leuconostoc miyukkimchii TaxID=910540 RepID=UPI001C7CD39C|nr:ABC transporter permease [Leuconostoc miyukkimchii]
MGTLIINEFRKLKRCDVLFVFFISLIFTDLLAVFQLYSGNEQSVYNYTDFMNIVIWDTFSLVLPAMIVIFSNYLINLENISGALKNNLTCAVSVSQLYASKLIILCLINLAFALSNAFLTYLLFLFLPHRSEPLYSSFSVMVQLLGTSFGVFIAVLPIIILFIRQASSYLNVVVAFVYGFIGVFVAGQNLQDFYPVTAFLKIVNYNNGSLIYHGNTSYITVFIVLLCSIIIWILVAQGLNNTDYS